MNTNGNGSVSRWWRALRRRRVDRDLAPYRRLALQLNYDLFGSDACRSLLLVTPTTSSVCAHSSALLACCAAEELRRPVLLIDVCPRDPATSRLLGCQDTRGFADILRSPELSLDEFVLPTSCENVSFLPAGGDVRASQPASPKDTDALLQAAEDHYDVVILSGGAVLNDSTALALAPRAGCVLLAVIENETRVTDLEAAQDTLSLCRARKVGLLLTTHMRRGTRAFRTAAHNGKGRKLD